LLRWWGRFVETGVHAVRPARDLAGKVKVDPVFQHLKKLRDIANANKGDDPV
jgi:hypothetical protein